VVGGEAGAKPARRAKVPTVLQMEAVECGAACLAMVLEYFGRVEPLEALRTACGVSRDGSKASNVVKAARAYGLLAKGYKREPEKVKKMRGPMIVHWNFNHFVVLEGFKRGRVYLNDPGNGPRTVTEEEFDAAFTGVVLTFEPGPDFEKGGARRSLLGALKARLSNAYLPIMFIALAGLAMVIPGLVIPTFYKIFIDDILVKGLVDWIQPLLIAMGATALVYGLLTWLRQTYLLRLETRLALSTSSKFLLHVFKLPMVFFTQRYAGEVGNRVGINDRVAQLVAGELATTILNVGAAGNDTGCCRIGAGGCTLGEPAVAGASTGGLSVASTWAGGAGAMVNRTRHATVPQKIVKTPKSIASVRVDRGVRSRSSGASRSIHSFACAWSAAVAAGRAGPSNPAVISATPSRGPPLRAYELRPVITLRRPCTDTP